MFINPENFIDAHRVSYEVFLKYEEDHKDELQHIIGKRGTVVGLVFDKRIEGYRKSMEMYRRGRLIWGVTCFTEDELTALQKCNDWPRIYRNVTVIPFVSKYRKDKDEEVWSDKENEDEWGDKMNSAIKCCLILYIALYFWRG